jgi:hypothetical protein
MPQGRGYNTNSRLGVNTAANRGRGNTGGTTARGMEDYTQAERMQVIMMGGQVYGGGRGGISPGSAARNIVITQTITKQRAAAAAKTVRAPSGPKGPANPGEEVAHQRRVTRGHQRRRHRRSAAQQS